MRTDLASPLDVWQERLGKNSIARRRILDDKEILFLLLDVLSDSDEGGADVRRQVFDCGVTAATVSNYFRYALFAKSRSFDGIHPNIIPWPNAERRAR